LRHLFAVIPCAAALGVIAACTPAPQMVEAPCNQPVPVNGKWDSSAPGYLVGYDSSIVDPLEISRRLGFEAESIFSDWGFYVRTLSPQVLARLRCESGIRYIDHNERIWIGRREAGIPNKPFQPIARDDARSG
jgi:hypothetical protein